MAEGIQQVLRKLDSEISKIKGNVLLGLEASGNEILRIALPNTPIDTSDLRNSGFVETNKDPKNPMAAVIFQATYAPFVHEDMTARHPVGNAKFLENAGIAFAPKIAAVVAKHAKVK